MKRGGLGLFLVFLLVMLLMNGLTIEYAFGTQEELAYDDGIPEGYIPNQVGYIDAVRFTPSVSGLLRRCAFYIYDEPAPFKIHVMDSGKNDVIDPFPWDVTDTWWTNVNLLPYEVSVSSGVDFYIGLEWTVDDAPRLGVDASFPCNLRSYHWDTSKWVYYGDVDWLIRATVGDEGEADIDVYPEHLDFDSGASSAASQSYSESFSLAETPEVCSVMQPNDATLQEWIESYDSAPRANVNSASIPATSSFSLLDHLEYDPSERRQGDCGNCWVWAGTGVMEVALDVQEGIKDRLSVQYFNSWYRGGAPYDWACCGGTLTKFARWYQNNLFVIPWSNTNAHWQDMNNDWTEGTSVQGSTISISPNYALTSCTAETIETQGVGQSQAIDNIKSVLGQDKAVDFGFFMPTEDDLEAFRIFWRDEEESEIWSFDYTNGHTWDDGAGHEVLCVGYDDTDPENSYWIMVNSWGTTADRPNGIFRLNMTMNYDCWMNGPNGVENTLEWQTLDVDFDLESQPVVVSNFGNEFLEVSSIEFDQPWLSVLEPFPSSFEVAPGRNHTVLVHADKSGLDAGVYYGNGNIYSNDPDENPVTFTVRLKVGSGISFDFGTASSPVESGYTPVTESTVYSAGSGYGWTSTSGLSSRDRGAPDNLNRDLVQSTTEHTFNVDLTNGDYTVTFTVGDQSYMHDNIDVYAEGTLEINDLTATAGSFMEMAFGVNVADGQLNLGILDDGGTDGNWVITALTVEPGLPPSPPTTGYFDFGTADSRVEPGYVQVTEATLYSTSTGYGWTSTLGLSSRDRGSADWLGQDFVQSTTEHTFSVDLANGDYEVSVRIGDESYMHDLIDVYAEDVLKIDDYIVDDGFPWMTFYTSISDGQLNLRLVDDGGVDANWVLNGLSVEPGSPPTLPTEGYFDFGPPRSSYSAPYKRVSENNLYSVSTGYGWSNIVGLTSRDRLAPDELRQDFVQSTTEHTFNADLANGDYQVTVTIGDQDYTHDLIDVYAEDVLAIDDLTSTAGAFPEVTFYVTLTDEQLNLRILDDGGTDVNWVITALTIESGSPPPLPTEAAFDFGTDSSPLETDYNKVTEATLYSPAQRYGWTSTSGLASRDRGSPDSLRCDLVQSTTEHTFNVDLENGDYTVIITIGDQSYAHDQIDVYAEGTLTIDDLDAAAGAFMEEVFGVTITDEQLNLRILDDGGTDVNWVITALTVEAGLPPAPPTEGYFDFGTSDSPVESTYTPVTEATVYSAVSGYGWSSTSGLSSRDRGAPDDDLNRDLVQSTTEHTFNVDLENGDYTVTVMIADQSYMHDNIDVYAEDILKIDDLTVAAGSFPEQVFAVTVSDGQLNLRILDGGGADGNWVINSIVVEPNFL